MGPYTLTVTDDPAIVQAVAGASDRSLAGFSTLEASLIGIRTTQPTSHTYQADTLLHELLHMAFRVSGFEFVDSATEEQVVLAASTNLLHALRENPDLVKFLTYKE